ncbi:hypothetical protein BBD42_18795 [Paenibacillus sp. BIHB 4019]|uniref:GGDEF domain-containing protein n=1 Tax=Paenibacillus sp. BIHB 4019 TaxID=1870819 RepID=A0A1B2DKP6_9BACL|nr:GGDEF domain-containing protein [Paenibacillus sp. BIHB 4019]ANY68294.1 hypothetical protein BBD42_18795 [Paenibacillus sp. BIHB 4019]
MDEMAIGLIHIELLQVMRESWRLGEIGVIYIRLAEERALPETWLLTWERKLKPFKLIWKRSFGQEYYIMLGCNGPRLGAEQAMNDSAAELHALASREQSVIIGHVIADPPAGQSHEAAEQAAWKALREAWRQAEMSSMRVSSKQAVEAAKSPGPDRQLGTMAAMALEERQSLQEIAVALEPEAAAIAYYAAPGMSIGEQAAPFPVFSAQARVTEIADFFNMNGKEQCVILQEEGRPVGLLMKQKLHELLAGKYGLPLYSTRPVEKIMNASPLIVDADMPIEHVSQLAMARDISHLYDVVIITAGGQLLGATTVRDILERITTLRMEAARSANPLTGLPGNEGIQLELARRSSGDKPFAVIYADLDYFKWFNDCFGFSQGDALIRFLADTLVGIKEEYGLASDFIGHIGGDDFIMVTEASYAEKICSRLIERFDGGVKRYYGGVEVSMVEDRHGNTVEQEGVTLSLSLMLASGGTAPSRISTLTAKLKKRAKMQKGSVYVMEDMTSCTQERNATEGIEVRRGTSSSDSAAKQPYSG